MKNTPKKKRPPGHNGVFSKESYVENEKFKTGMLFLYRVVSRTRMLHEPWSVPEFRSVDPDQIFCTIAAINGLKKTGWKIPG